MYRCTKLNKLVLPCDMFQYLQKREEEGRPASKGWHAVVYRWGSRGQVEEGVPQEAQVDWQGAEGAEKALLDRRGQSTGC